MLKTSEGEAYLEILGDFTNETLEGGLADEQLGGLLVPSDLTKGDSTGPETMGLLHTTGSGLEWQCRQRQRERRRAHQQGRRGQGKEGTHGGRSLPGGLGGELLTGGLACEEESTMNTESPMSRE